MPQSERQLNTDGGLEHALGEGNFRGALQLEALWNDLRRRESFTLLCGYAAVHFGDPKVADALRRTCHAHSAVRTNPRDVLATFLLEATSR